ncbi:hypothetical protein GT755_09765 [Herbidospora sp. NEAU-GS84]|uniref:Uncharacterized protein n=1 Tax=Herbidospora solisilvae TaxID=2696284 RepID=A0A7C9MZD3_9ACTN|nr:hypothetical protein [Herbidospora solisilvae]NAS21970.1 hypothetical protein [Herbidospora solisilvae]
MSVHSTTTAATEPGDDLDLTEYDLCGCLLCLDGPPTLASMLVNPDWVAVSRDGSRTLISDRYVILDAGRAQLRGLPEQDGIYDLTGPYPVLYGCALDVLPRVWDQATGPRVGTNPALVTWSDWSYQQRRIGFLPGVHPVAAHNAVADHPTRWHLSGGADGTTLLITHPHTGQICGAIARLTLPTTPDFTPILTAITTSITTDWLT